MVPMPADIPAGLVKATPEALLFEGGVATGKTQALVDRVAGLLDKGVSAGEVLVLCAAPGAVQAFKARLLAARPDASAVEVTTPRQWSLRALGRPGAQREPGLGVRMLAPFEVDVLMEDLKTCGVKPGRLKEMLRFFYKSQTELCDWEDDWLLTGEERLVHGLLQDCLRFVGGILEPQVCNAACRLLLGGQGGSGADELGYDHVLADDYQLMSRASQVLANGLARASIAVAANPQACVETFDSYPYERGVQEFLDANPHAKVARLATSFACEAAVAAARGICAHRLVGGEGAACGNDLGARELRRIWAATPSEELADVCDVVGQAARDGRTACVVAPNALWARNVAHALEGRGIEVRRGFSAASARGDMRDLGRCAVPRMLTALALLADPCDGVALRTWCGMGEVFAASSAVAAVRERALRDDVPASEAFSRYCMPEGQAPQMREENDHLTRAVQAAGKLAHTFGGLRGADLLDALAGELIGAGAPVPDMVSRLTEPLPDGRFAGDDARSLNARARERLCAPAYFGQGGVTVTTMGLGITGETPDVVVLCGMVDGYFPSKGVLDRELMVQEDADKQEAKDLRRLLGAVGKPRRALVATGFSQTGLEAAEKTGMRIARVQLDEDGRRVALAKPSAYLAYMG